MSATLDEMEFYLRRHIRAAEDIADVNQEELARRGVPYGERMAILEKAEGAAREAKALRAALEIVQLAGVPKTR